MIWRAPRTPVAIAFELNPRPLACYASGVSLPLAHQATPDRHHRRDHPPATDHLLRAPRLRPPRRSRPGRHPGRARRRLPRKSEAGERTIPLPTMVANTLKEWGLARPRREGKLDLFPSGEGNVECHSNIVSRGLNPLSMNLQRHGLTQPPLSREDWGGAGRRNQSRVPERQMYRRHQEAASLHASANLRRCP